MTEKKRMAMILLLALAALGLFVAAGSLSNLQFQPGQPFTLENAQLGDSSNIPPMFSGEFFVALFRGLLGLALLMLPIYIITNLLTPEGRRRLLSDAVMLTLVFIMVLTVSEITKRMPQTQNQQPALGLPPPDSAQLPDQGSPLKFIPGSPSAWLVYLLSFGLAAVILGAGALIARSVWKRFKPSSPSDDDKIAAAAQEAMDALAAGGNLKDIILRCYLQMGQVLEERRGIRRRAEMTPAEFERLLVGSGLPEIPIQRLTRLFEVVRYGHIQPGNVEEQQALDSLQAIVQAVKG